MKNEKEREAIERYEQYVLNGKSFILSGTPEEKKQDALTIMDYIFTDVLRWTPSDAMNHITADVAKNTGIELCMKYLQFPRDIEKKDYYKYAVSLCYPQMKFDYTAQILELHSKVKNGEMRKFPKHVFSGPEGREKAAILLRNFIARKIMFESTSHLYEIFADSSRINSMLKEDQIYYVCHQIYSTPLDYLHASLHAEEQDDFLYSFYQYMNVGGLLMRRHIQEQKKCANGHSS